MNIYSKEIIERFWKKVDISKESDCWNWTASKNSKGYGTFCTGKRKNGKPRIENSHRVAYKIVKGEIPDGMLICHHCDNPGCCNPKHLFSGTSQDNMDDKVMKGRQTNGSKNGRAKLSSEQVQNIRNLYATGDFSCRKLSAIFLVSYSHIAKIVKGEYWKLPLAE